ncbi:unnamed protein product [Moneuplotes crassus]|uniref:Uncharacterized protein n=1 Tax=Euplotes crassus TaxID=5936 RepID=A0AAD1U7W8_EUPCR|nr:unnamed protein product [Moneuplotes crassus]
MEKKKVSGKIRLLKVTQNGSKSTLKRHLRGFFTSTAPKTFKDYQEIYQALIGKKKDLFKYFNFMLNCVQNKRVSDNEFNYFNKINLCRFEIEKIAQEMDDFQRNFSRESLKGFLTHKEIRNKIIGSLENISYYTSEILDLEIVHKSYHQIQYFCDNLKIEINSDIETSAKLSLGISEESHQTPAKPTIQDFEPGKYKSECISTKPSSKVSTTVKTRLLDKCQVSVERSLTTMVSTPGLFGKRRQPVGGFGPEEEYRQKRSKVILSKFDENEEDKKQQSETQMVPQGRCSLSRIIAKSKIYKWLMYGMKAVKTLAPGIMISMAYDTIQQCSMACKNPAISPEKNSVLKAILGNRNIGIKDFSNFTTGVGTSALSASIPNLMMKYSTYINLYIDKLKSQSVSEVACASATTKLVFLCIGSLAYFLYIMKTKRSTVQPVPEEEQKDLLPDSDDEDYMCTKEMERLETEQDAEDDINYDNFCIEGFQSDEDFSLDRSSNSITFDENHLNPEFEEAERYFLRSRTPKLKAQPLVSHEEEPGYDRQD